MAHVDDLLRAQARKSEHLAKVDQDRQASGLIQKTLSATDAALLRSYQRQAQVRESFVDETPETPEQSATRRTSERLMRAAGLGGGRDA